MTIRQFAELAGTSVATISRVMSGKPGVSDKRREEIRNLAHRLGYRPSRMAANLSMQRSRIIGFVASDIRNPMYVDFLKRMDVYCKEQDFHTLVTDSNIDAGQERKNIETMLQHRVEGLVVFPVCDLIRGQGEENLEELRRSGVPTVVMGLEPESGLDCVTTEETQACRILARHLLDLGHRKFWVLGKNPVNRPARERVKGLRDAIRAFEKSGKAAGGAVSVHYARDEVADIVAEGLELLADTSKRPTAIIATSSPLLLPIFRLLGERGLTVPGDISLAGIDDLDWCRQMYPSITTVGADFSEVCDEALRVLHARIAEPDAPAVKSILPRRLVVRESCGPAA